MGNKHFDFRWDFKNFSIRTLHEVYGDRTTLLRKNCPIELVKYLNDNHSSCYVVAYFGLDDEGYELRFVGNRPFKDISPEEMASIWSQLGAAQKMLDAYFEAYESEKD